VEGTPAEELGPATSLRKLSECTHFANEAQRSNVMCPRRQHPILTVSVKGGEGAREEGACGLEKEHCAKRLRELF
jgi:hypothetical protein